MEITIQGLEELSKFAQQLLEYAGNRKVFAFQGEIGAGKTTLIQYLCQHLGVKEEVTSPTFALVNEYHSPGQGKDNRIFHLDLYRLKDLSEALNIGIEEYLDSGAHCFIEWPEIIESLLPEDLIVVKIILTKESSRKIIFL